MNAAPPVAPWQRRKAIKAGTLDAKPAPALVTTSAATDTRKINCAPHASMVGPVARTEIEDARRNALITHGSRSTLPR